MEIGDRVKLLDSPITKVIREYSKFTITTETILVVKEKYTAGSSPWLLVECFKPNGRDWAFWVVESDVTKAENGIGKEW